MLKWDQDMKTSEINNLYNAILALQTTEEAGLFFRDLLTESEIDEFARRWMAAKMLWEGKTYQTIQTTTGLSSTTVARISKWLNSGMDGYKIILNRMHHHGDPPETS